MSGNFFSLSSQKLQIIREKPLMASVNAFMRSPAYIIVLAVLTAVSNLLSLDLYLYTVFILAGAFIALFGADLLPLMPIVVLCYVAPSPSNNPGSASNTGSIFHAENGGIYLAVMICLLVISVVLRLLTDQELGGRAFFSKPRKLLSGMLLLCCGYLFSGLGMENYGAASWKVLLCVLCAGAASYLIGLRLSRTAGLGNGPVDKQLLIAALIPSLCVFVVFGLVGQLGGLPRRNMLFAVIQCAAVVVLYYLFSGTIRWKQVPKSYLAWMGMCIGYVVLVQLLENYISGRIFMKGTGTIDRELIYAGWGMHNNIGGMMAFMLPFPFYLACTQKRSWMFNVLGTILLLGVIISCSRTSMLVAMAIYGFCVYQLLRRKECRKANVSVYVVIAGLVVVSCILFFDRLMDIFALFFEELFVMSERDNLISYGFKQFLDNPIFGGSFFPQGKYVPWDWSNSAEFSSFFPPRWHNTLIQMLASCGIVGFAAYCCHRWQTVKLMLKQRSTENLFISLFLISLLVCSLMDCHFFNVGPVLFYSMALAYGENIHESKL
ncbi:MAG: O-antigen ligase family protein [Ruminococcaceae bacterium]|nr:O-antigen ligase family protein [Oscillospiraceae bacterium]